MCHSGEKSVCWPQKGCWGVAALVNLPVEGAQPAVHSGEKAFRWLQEGGGLANLLVEGAQPVPDHGEKSDCWPLEGCYGAAWSDLPVEGAPTCSTPEISLSAGLGNILKG